MSTKINTPPQKAWAQVADQALNVPPSGSPQMRRVYKLPTSCCKDILNKVVKGTSQAAVENWIHTAAGALDSGLSGSSFNPLSGDHWILDSYQLDQIEAGEYMLLRSVFTFTDLDIDTIADDDDWSETYSNGQQVSWTTYSVSPYIYCDEVEHEDILAPDIGAPVSPPIGGHAKRRHIEQAFTQNANDSDNQTYIWRNSTSLSAWALTDAERKIMDKVAAGVNPVFHKPIVQVSYTTRTVTEWLVPTPNHDVDKISTPPVYVPGWPGDFIFCGRSFTKSKDTYYTQQHPEGVTIYSMSYTDVWEGALEPDADFYGNYAWQFHVGPCT